MTRPMAEQRCAMQKFIYQEFTENLMSSVATGNVMTSSSCEWTTRHYSSPSKYRTQCVAQLKVDSAWSSSRLDTRQTSIDQVSSGQNFKRSLRRRTNLIPKRRSSGLIIGPPTKGTAWVFDGPSPSILKVYKVSSLNSQGARLTFFSFSFFAPL